jgi:hypothetical protein
VKRKTKFCLGTVTVLAVISAAALVAAAFSLGAIVKKGIEMFGPGATGVDVRLQSAQVWLLDGRAQLDGLVVGNPQGCKTPEAIVADKVSARIKTASVFSGKVVIERLEFKAPVVTLEGGLKDNNLTKIEKNLDDYCAGLSAAPKSPAASTGPAKPKRTWQVNDLVITGAKVRVNTKVTLGYTVTLPLPDIHLTNLGAGREGIAAAQVAKEALNAVEDAATTTIEKDAGGLARKAGDAAKTAAQKAAGTLKDLIH